MRDLFDGKSRIERCFPKIVMRFDFRVPRALFLIACHARNENWFWDVQWFEFFYSF